MADVRIELSEEFDRNFEKKSFFSEKWKRKRSPGNQSLLIRTSALRRSIRGQIAGKTISFSSSLAYASIHNNGGEITITSESKIENLKAIHNDYGVRCDPF